MGHALNNTLQDVLCRFERMRGKDVLWQPGTDHAGIATQLVVERQMMERQEPDRRKIGREKFVEKVWAWKDESGGTIINQLKRLGASCDWSRERFTMDEGLSKAVAQGVRRLYKAGLIYKDKRLVNWDPEFQTAISDLEVEQVEARGSFEWTAGDPEKPFDAEALARRSTRNPSGHMYHFRYPLAQGAGLRQGLHRRRHDAARDDAGRHRRRRASRGRALRGADQGRRKVMLPLVGREIPIVADEYSDPEKGTGAVKITPAHDFNDFEVGKRHELELINILDDRGAHQRRRAGGVPRRSIASRRASASSPIWNALGLLEKIEPTTHAVPHGERGNAVIEPWLTDQWYVNAAELAKPAIAAVESGKTTFVPKNWEKTYFEWMRNIQPWCISRQLWWGHQIPAWYGPDGQVFVAEDEAARAGAGRRALRQGDAR